VLCAALSDLTSGALIKSGKFSVKKRGLFEQAKLASFRALGKREQFLVEDVQTACFFDSFLCTSKEMNRKKGKN
jgi:hypothetical protein